jgi:hypothetical protein
MTAVDFIARAFAVYALTMLMASSHIAKPARRWFRSFAWIILPFAIVGKFVKFEHVDESPKTRPVLEDDEDLDIRFERKIAGYDFIACRICLAVWITAGLWASGWFLCDVIAVYGAAQFLHTQERE